MENELGMVLHMLMRAHHNACMAALAQRGVEDVGSPRLLVQLAQYPDGPEGAPTQKELADKLHSAPPTVAASLKVLERQGYVERRTDQKDTRRNRISITQKGRDAIAQSMDAFRQVDGHMYHGFSPEERALADALFSRMLENLYQIGGARRQDPIPDPLAPPPPPEGPSHDPF